MVLGKAILRAKVVAPNSDYYSFYERPFCCENIKTFFRHKYFEQNHRKSSRKLAESSPENEQKTESIFLWAAATDAMQSITDALETFFYLLG